jgi:hypothetical protein
VSSGDAARCIVTGMIARSMRVRLSGVSLTAVLVGLLAGCDSFAEIRRPRSLGGPVKGKILSGDRRNVYVQSDPGRILVRRTDIQDIDHPGNGMAVFGGILSAYGVFNIAVSAPQCQDHGEAFCVGVFTPLAVGLPVLIWGIATYARSVSATHMGLADGQPVYSPPVDDPAQAPRPGAPSSEPPMTQPSSTRQGGAQGAPFQ